MLENLATVEELSREVGLFLKNEQKHIQEADIEFKGRTNDLVSRADKEAETLFVEALERLIPEAGFIAEEGTSTKRGDRFNWIIDPLDGTTNYLYGIPCYCTSVALIDGDDLVLGVIYDPERDECFSAAKGHGAKLNGEPIRVSRQAELSKSLIATGFPYDNRGRQREYLDILEKVNRNTRGIRRLGSAALDLAYVACGRFDAFYEYGLNPWDCAAGALIILEAGGEVTDFKGKGNYLFGSNILSSNEIIHSDMLQFTKDWD
jgi:myo-inositol-1(or 4)-monophosphatase